MMIICLMMIVMSMLEGGLVVIMIMSIEQL